MIVTFISQCEKKALNRTRRVLDSFADRIGERTWQTVITEDGLLAVKKLLRKTATKNTAVSCHWIRSRSRSQLLWIVGNRRQFDIQGRVPTNRTQKNLNTVNEQGWCFGQSIQIVAVLAALLHDLGKASVGFQKKLHGDKTLSALKGDPYRHEWVSMRIFQAIVGEAKTDEQWLNYLVDFDQFEKQYPDWQKNIIQDKLDHPKPTAWHNLPPLAQALGWLITTHHRLPFYRDNEFDLCKRKIEEVFDKYLFPIDGWVSNIFEQDIPDKQQKPFWTFEQMATDSKPWRKDMARWAKKALNDPNLSKQKDFSFFDPLFMHLSRMSLMVGDHAYSSLPTNPKLGETHFPLYANTEKKEYPQQKTRMRQRLDEHLLGVSDFTKRFSRLLPKIAHNLPSIADHQNFKQHNNIPKYKWQNKAYDLACSLQQKSQEQGFFGVNMASTGCGKTLGNGRIIYGLSDPEQGTRFTIALGLRVLTLQTGHEYRERMSLSEEDLAILVGGQAVIDLFNLAKKDDQGTFIELTASEQGKQEQEINSQTERRLAQQYGLGSESAMALEESYVHFDSPIDDQHLGAVVQDPRAKKLLYAPIVTCTIDHLMGATETARGGKYISPMLRLLSSDLILDEPDDFNLEDFPALSRLVNMAGMLGSRVLLSSATLPPDLLAGLFEAYQAGRQIWNRHQQFHNPNIVCAWFDEYHTQQADCADLTCFEQQHNHFIVKRAKKLDESSVLRYADTLPLSVKPRSAQEKDINYKTLASDLLKGVEPLHQQHHQICPYTQKKVSFGLIRLSNITPLVQLAEALFQSEGLANTQIHLSVYHAKQLFALRSHLETQLDCILNRKEPEKIFSHTQVFEQLNNSQKEHHIFIVLATPVAEVGRDHDYDWALVEPSSMRSIIQLAGRIQRHRQQTATIPNMLIWATNIKALKQGNDLGVNLKKPVFCRPGFEQHKNKLLNKNAIMTSHKTEKILEDDLGRIHAKPRIQKTSRSELARLEHAVIQALMNNQKEVNWVNARWRYSANHYVYFIQKQTPFRKSRRKNRYMYLQNDEGEFKFQKDQTEVGGFIHYPLQIKTQVIPWLNPQYEEVIDTLAQDFKTDNRQQICKRFGFVDLEEDEHKWWFHPILGFWPNR